MLFVQLPVRADQSVTLAWNPSVDTNIVGYKIYAGTGSRNYSITNVVAPATNTTTTVTGLVEGRTYYFAATTYDNNGDESVFSAEATYTVPVTPPTLDTPMSTGNQFSFSVSGVTGYQYVVQTSTNLTDWVSLQTNTAPFTFVDPNAVAFSQRYYRTYYLLQ